MVAPASPTNRPAARQRPAVLVTGFDPFGGDQINPSWEAVRAIDGSRIAGRRIVGAQLPTAFGASLQRLDQLLQEHQPELVVCVGQAGGRPALSLERVAINVDDARIPDNAGLQPVDQPVVAGGPAAYFSSLPIKAMQQALARKGIAAEVSQTAGTFVCNHVFYGLMHLLARPQWQATRGGFIHVPWLPGQGQPSMSLPDIIAGLELAIGCALATRRDARVQAGALH